MALTSKQTRRVEIPHEPDEWMEFRRLNHVQLDEIQTVAMQGMASRFGGGVADLLKTLRPGDTAQALDTPEAREALDDPLGGYDLPTLLAAGIVAWSYDAPVTREATDDLDPTTARWAGEAIVAYSKGERTEAERGEG